MIVLLLQAKVCTLIKATRGGAEFLVLVLASAS
jgi:hypothetical protein